MVLHLMKKDILIAKKFVLIIMLIMIILPIIMLWSAPTLPGVVSFLYAVSTGEIMLLQVISQEEAKYPKATALLCTTSYSRSDIVKAKYALFLILFAYGCIAHTFLTLLLNPSGILSLTEILAVLLLCVLIYGVYMPIEFKYGNVKAKFIFMIVVISMSFGPVIITSVFKDVKIDFSLLSNLSYGIVNAALMITSIVILCVSMLVSIKVFTKKEL